jgi:hypothetical protein
VSNIAISAYELFPVAIINKLKMPYVLGKLLVELFIVLCAIVIGMFAFGFNSSMMG